MKNKIGVERENKERKKTKRKEKKIELMNKS